MAISETMLAIQPSGEPASTMLRSCNTMNDTKQAKRQAEPLQTRDLSRPMKRLAIVDVRIGCRPGISAEMPAGTP